MKIKTTLLWLVLMPTIIFIDIICFLIGIFSKEVRQLYIHSFYNKKGIFKQAGRKIKRSECPRSNYKDNKKYYKWYKKVIPINCVA